MGLSRREILRTTGAGFGALALAGMLSERVRADQPVQPKAGPLAPKEPHFAAKAKRIIFVFLSKEPFRSLILGSTNPSCKNMNGKAGAPVVAR